MSEVGKSKSPVSSRVGWATGLAAAVAVFAVLVSAVVLLLSGQRQQAEAAIPFVVPHVMGVHLICVLPFAVWLGWQCVARLPNGLVASVGWLAVVLGGLTASVTYLAAPGLALVSAGSGPLGCAVLRLGVAMMLLFPWGLAAAAVLRTGGFEYRAMWFDALIVVLLLAMPIIHVQQVDRRLSQVVADQVVNQQFARAEQNCRQLVALGRPAIGDQPSAGVLAALQQRLASYAQQVSTPLVSDALPAQRIDRARLLFGLGRLDEATQILEPLADGHPEAGVRLGLVFEVEGRYSAAAERYRKVIEALKPSRPLDARQLSLLRISLERRANNLRRANDSLRAERELKEAREAWPEAEAAVLMQLGFHYQMAGRSNESIAAFERAVQLDASLERQVAIERQKLDVEAQGCMIRLTRGITR